MTDLASRFAADLAATTLTDVTGGGLAAAAAGSYLVNFTNRTASAVTVRLAVTSGAAAGNADYLEYDASIPSNGVLSRWPIPLATGWKVFAYASATGVSVNLIGRKEG